MKLRYRIFVSNLDALSYSGDALSIAFKNIDNWEYNAVQGTDSFSIDISSSSIAVDFYNESGGGQQYTQDFTSLSTIDDFIEFNGDLYIGLDDLQKFIEIGIIEIDTTDTLIYCFKQNSENDALNKSLTTGEIIAGKFNHSIGVKNINIDVKNYSLTNAYNYVFIPSLKRYYYVDSVEIISADYKRLHLKEDVLMTWKDLIKSQSAFVTRYGNATDKSLIDERYPLKDIPSTQYFTPVNVAGASVSQFKYVMDSNGLNVLLKTKDETLTFLAQDNIPAPTGTNLPVLQNTRCDVDHLYMLKVSDYAHVIHACLLNDNPATYIHSILLFPFDFHDIIPNYQSTIRQSRLYCGGKLLGIGTNGYEWKSYTDVAQSDPYFYETNLGQSPYIVVADFMFNVSGGVTITDSFLDYSPNTLWEIYLSFVGWVQVDAKQLYNKRIMIYYTIDFDTGLSTAYIYNRTDDKIIHSSTCQLGMRLSVATSNIEELSKQKQATSLNLIMGLLSSSLAIVGGGASGNALAVAGGVLSAGKTISGAVNSFNTMFERAQISYGSSDNALYSPNSIVIRKTTHQSVISGASELAEYQKLNGYPYRKFVDLNTLSSDYYVEIGTIHFNPMNADIYQDEITEIVELLQNGVIF